MVSILQTHGYECKIDELSQCLDKAFMSSTKGEVQNTREFWELVLKKLGISPTSSLLMETEEFWNKNVHQQIKFYENAIPTLSQLQEDYKLALVSNCSVGMREIIKTLGLDQFFECITLSYELKVRKPDSRMYLNALNSLELKAEDCVFVADQISDLEGARDVGLKTILIRQGKNANLDIKYQVFKPDYEFTKISEIIKIL